VALAFRSGGREAREASELRVHDHVEAGRPDETQMENRPFIGLAGSYLRQSWKSLILTDITYHLIALVVLTPLTGVLFRLLIAAGGKTILTDQDILLYFLGPVGWVCFVAAGTLWLGIKAVEQAALLGIIGAATQQKRMGVLSALRFAAGNSRSILLVAGRLVRGTLLVIAPSLALAALVYLELLTQFDINYYLKERPADFQVAIAIFAVLGAITGGLLLWLASSWLFALPLLLFERISDRDALRISRQRVRGHRREVFLWIGGWALTTTIISMLATTSIFGMARFCVPYLAGSLWLLMAAVGMTLVLWTGAGMLISLLATISFAVLLFHLYRKIAIPENIDISSLCFADAATYEGCQFFTRWKLLGAAAATVLLALAIGFISVHSLQIEDKTAIMAHRGASNVAPENTLAAIKQAISDGADWVEIDVQETADGEVAVMHDSDFMRLAGLNLKIWNATSKDLEKIDVGSWFDPRFKDERVPKLKELLLVCKGKIRVNIELKYYGHDDQLEQRVVEIVEGVNMAPNVLVMSLNAEAIKKMKSLRPSWKVGQLMSVSAGRLQNIDADFIAVNSTFADRKFVRTVHDMGKDVYVWTVDDAPAMSAMMSRGVDGLITDNPALARSVRDFRAAKSPPERLLLELVGWLGVRPEMPQL
jgi:glycerophosphoryl diester phosphodiesterase